MLYLTALTRWLVTYSSLVSLVSGGCSSVINFVVVKKEIIKSVRDESSLLTAQAHCYGFGVEK